MELYKIFSGEELRIAEKIQQRRLQILIHSYLYYERDTNIVPDSKWAEWGKELVSLTEKYPEVAKQVPYGEGFEDFDASTGYGLPYDKPNLVKTACKLANIPIIIVDPVPAKPAPVKKPTPSKQKNSGKKRLF